MQGLWSLVLLPLWAAVLLGSSPALSKPLPPSFARREARRAAAVVSAQGAVSSPPGARSKNPKGLKKKSAPVKALAKAGPTRKVDSKLKARPKPTPKRSSDKHRKTPAKAKPVSKKVADKRAKQALTKKINQASILKAKVAKKKNSFMTKAQKTQKTQNKRPASLVESPTDRMKAAAKPKKQQAVPKKSSPAKKSTPAKKSGAKKFPPSASLYEAQRAKAKAQRASTAGGQPANMVPDVGQELTITDHAAFVKEFTISFKVKFDNFTKNDMIFIATDQHALEIQALGPKYGVNSTKIGAFMKTESGLGPAGHGVHGSDGQGQLLSQALNTNQWYDVSFVKTPTQISLTVGGVTESSAIDTHIIIADTDFDLEAGSTKLVAGEMAGSGDIGLNGELGDLALVEGPPAATPAATLF